MHSTKRFPFSLSVLTTMVVMLSILAGTFAFRENASATNASTSQSYHQHIVGAQPFWQEAVDANKGILPCTNSPVIPRCYSPQQIRSIYNIQPLLNAGITGKGRTIVIIDAYQDPNIRTDLRLYDKIFGLPDPTLNIFAPFGLTPFNPQDPTAVDSATEIALDVQSAHSIAPNATIDLVLANVDFAKSTETQDATALLKATKFAIDNNLGDTISQSFGLDETCVSSAYLQAQRAAFEEARNKHITVFASSGDSGAAGNICKGSSTTLGRGIQVPEADPLVTSVGGTRLNANAKGTSYVSESVWNDSSVSLPAGNTASSGGFSVIYPRPAYQNGVAGIGAGRATPDVAYNADNLTGVPIVLTLGRASVIVPIGGTSAGSPQWAGIIALADQLAGKRLGFINASLYRIYKSYAYSSNFHDVTVGNNSYSFKDPKTGKGVTIPGYNAGPGWDPCTGIGSPKVTPLAKLLVKYS